ncbi:hypothetical protein BH11PLA1_BH11PLA1_01180 [soil metagenome]
MIDPSTPRAYFVDEAGDTTLFDARGSLIVGKPGVSRCFMLGVADITDVSTATARLQELRKNLLADPYFRGVPSMSSDGGKTALCFHAKDDLPEVRREVFRLLPTLPATVQIVIRRKETLAQEARALFAIGRRLGASDTYDDLVKRLFKNLLHRGTETHVCFARRGKDDRHDSLTRALARAAENFRSQWNRDTPVRFTIRSSTPSADPCLQIADYLLWAVQRLFERGEDRYFQLVAPQCKLIIDLDDRSLKPYGRWYTSKDPLTLQKMKPLAS